MLKLLDQYTAADGATVEIFQTAHSGPNFHVRYGLQVTAHVTYAAAVHEFDLCVGHARECNRT